MYKLWFYHNSEGYRNYGEYINLKDARMVASGLSTGSSCINGRFEIEKL